jgi:hypothetical protein
VTPVIVEHNKSAAIAALSDQSILPEVMQSWVNGTSFVVIWNLMIERNIRLGGNRRRPIVEHAVGGNSERAGVVLSEYRAYFSQVLKELGV